MQVTTRGSSSPARSSNRGGTTTTSATGSDLESERALTARYCALVERRTAPLATRLTQADQTTDVLAALVIYGDVAKQSRAIVDELQTQFDAEYSTNMNRSSKESVNDRGYDKGNNPNSLNWSKVELLADIGAMTRMRDAAIPPSKSFDHGIAQTARAADACATPESRALFKKLGEIKVPEPTFRVHYWTMEDAMPAKSGDLVEIGFGVANTTPDVVVRRQFGPPVTKNCRNTSRVWQIQENGRVEYEQECEYAGGRRIVVQVTLKGASKLVPASIGVRTGDFVHAIGRLAAIKRTVATVGNLTTTTHELVVDVTAVTEVDRSPGELKLLGAVYTY